MATNGISALTGSLGKAVVAGQLITRLTGWRVRESIGETAWGDSDSAGFTNRKGSRLDGTGSIMGKFDTTKTPYAVFRAGDIVTLALWQTAAALNYWYFPSVLIQNFELEFSPDSKEVVQWSADFGADGVFYYPSESGAPSVSLPSS